LKCRPFYFRVNSLGHFQQRPGLIQNNFRGILTSRFTFLLWLRMGW
jgi:hypothetical protein